jgi:endonuclease YncB( thermonuclease family)
MMRMASRGRVFGVVCALAVLCGAPPGAAQPLTGTAVIVHDGDTVSVQTSHGIVRVRLAGIDCPELAQPRGPEAKAFTARLVLGRTVRVESGGTDQYSRVLGRLVVDGADVNVALVRAGMAWRYQSPGNDRILMDAERTARTAHAGIWSDPNPEPPWQWRREHGVRGDQAADSSPRRHRSAVERVSLSEARGPFHGNTRSHVFHRPGCPNYNCKGCEETFLNVQSAEEAGYQPAGDCLER